MFFQDYWTWLQSTLNGFIATQAAIAASALAPVIVTLATIYVMLWGYLMLTGQIQEPILDGFKRIVTVAVILGIAINLWLYNGPIVDTFFRAPFELSAAMVGAPPLAMIDSIWSRGTDVAALFWANAGVLNGEFGLYLVTFIVWGITGLLCVYAMFLLALARIALAILLALGPLFIGLLFFDSTKRFFEAWIAQLANYGFIAILTGAVAALVLSLVNSFAASSYEIGAGIQFADTAYFLLTAVLAFLLLRQVMPIAAGLASGIALSSGGLVGRAVAGGLGTANTAGRGVWDALTGAGTTRWDPMARKLGYWPTHRIAQGGRATATAIWRVARGQNTLTKKS